MEWLTVERICCLMFNAGMNEALLGSVLFASYSVWQHVSHATASYAIDIHTQVFMNTNQNTQIISSTP